MSPSDRARSAGTDRAANYSPLTASDGTAVTSEGHRPWPDRVHEQVEWEVEAAYHLGRADGVRLASAAYSSAIEAALQRPQGHGGRDLDEVTRGIVRRLYRDHLGVGA